MCIFSIDGTNFAVDATKSSMRLDALGNGMLEINIDIHGDDAVFTRLMEEEEEEEDGAWSWALYPPVFFLHGLRVAEGSPGAAVTGPLGSSLDDAEAGIYMMEYGDISLVDIGELSPRRLAVSGTVELYGRQLPFTIHIDMPQGGRGA